MCLKYNTLNVNLCALSWKSHIKWNKCDIYFLTPIVGGGRAPALTDPQYTTRPWPRGCELLNLHASQTKANTLLLLTNLMGFFSCSVLIWVYPLSPNTSKKTQLNGSVYHCSGTVKMHLKVCLVCQILFKNKTAFTDLWLVVRSPDQGPTYISIWTTTQLKPISIYNLVRKSSYKLFWSWLATRMITNINQKYI